MMINLHVVDQVAWTGSIDLQSWLVAKWPTLIRPSLESRIGQRLQCSHYKHFNSLYFPPWWQCWGKRKVVQPTNKPGSCRRSKSPIIE